MTGAEQPAPDFEPWVNRDALADQAQAEAEIGPLMDGTSLGAAKHFVDAALTDKDKEAIRTRLNKPVADQN
jgi:hypothetical protein